MRELDRLINATFTRIDGVVVQKDGHGYLVMGKYCESLEDVKRVIQSAGQSLLKSIR